MKRAPILPLVQALTYLQLVSFANNLKVRLRRLKQPKYLVGALVGGAYVSLYLGNTLLWRFRTGGRAGESGWFADAGGLITSLAAVGVLFWMLTEWIFPAKRAALQFTETELAFLLPAPMTRRMLIQFKLLKSQIPLLFTSGLFTLIGGAGGSGWLHRWIGWWFVLFTLNLHGIGASFVLTRLWDRGLTPWPRRALVLSILGAVAGILGYWAWRGVPGAPGAEGDLEQWREWGLRALTTGPVHVVLTPFRWILGPWAAAGTADFLRALPGAALVLGLHYVWVLASEVSFEEASLVAARKRAELVAVARSGRNPLTTQARRPLRPLFRLAPTGFPAVALVWKNLIATGSSLNKRLVIGIVVWIALMGWGLAGDFSAKEGWNPTWFVAGFTGIALGASLFVGPQVLRGDFRQDYESMDVLKALPLPGWQVVLGQLVGPAFLLTAVQWAMIGILVSTTEGHRFGGDPVPFLARLVLGLSVGLLLPGFNLMSLVIPNALVLLFPAWVQTGKEGPMGIEVMGQRLVVALGSFFVLVVGLFPAALLVAAVVYLFRVLSLPAEPSWILGGLGGLLVFLSEFAVAVWLLGGVFERFDLSRE